MKQEQDIVSLVVSAQTDPQKADALIEQYLPFIQAEAAKYTHHLPPSQAEDGLSIAMFAFYEAMQQYQPSKGAFLKLASVAIKHRLIDQFRKIQRHTGHLSLDEIREEEHPLAEQIADSRADLSAQQERADAQQEIGHFTQVLSLFGLSLTDIAQNCPKQERTMHACMEVLDYARKNPALLSQLEQTKKLPLSQLVLGTGADRKTLERHRKYLVAILLAYTNGFEIIRGHLQLIGRKEATVL